MKQAKVKKEEEEYLGEKSDSPLQKMLANPLFDAFILVVIVINCIFMALSNPRLTTGESDAYYIEVGSYFFNMIFVTELILKLIGNGPVKYFGDRWNKLDFIVAIVCLLDLLFQLIIACANAVGSASSSNFGSSSDVTKFLRVLRILRIIRALRTVTLIPSIMVYASALSECIDKVLISALLLGIVLLGMGFISYYKIGDNLLLRCVPSSTASVSTLMADDYYAAYGSDYFYSKYNINYCGGYSNTNACGEGFECMKIRLLEYEGVGADFSTPYRAFVSNFSFLTMRGWPNIFWAIVDTTDTSTAILIVLLIIICGNMMIFNLLPATFIVSLKTSQETEVLVNYLTQYPGDLESVSELDLRIWANANRSHLSHDRIQNNGNKIIRLLGTLSSKFYSKYISGNDQNPNKGRKDTAKKLDMIKNVDKIDISSNIHFVTKKERSDLEDELDQLNNSTDVSGYMCVPQGHIAAKWRNIITNEMGYFNIFMLCCIVANIIVLSMEKSNMSSEERKGENIANKVFTSFFLAELILKMGILGPPAYFSSGWNVVDFLVVITSVPVLFGTSSNKFMTNFRLIRFFRFAKLTRISKLMGAVSKIFSTIDDDDSHASISLTLLIQMMGDTVLPIINTAIVLMLLLFIFTLLGMQLFVLPIPPSEIISVNYTSYNQSVYTPLIDLERTITSGVYLDRMNWDNFANGYVTMFNISLLNGWYYVMTDCIRTSGGFAIIFFLVFIFLSNYFLLATLLSSVSAVMEEYGKNKLALDALQNQQVITNYTILRNKMIVKAYFARLKENTLGKDEDNDVATPSVAPNISLGKSVPSSVDNRLEAREEKQYVPWYIKVFKRRNKHSLYLFSPDSYLRRFCTFLLSTSLMKIIVSIAVIINLLDLVRAGSVGGRKIDHFTVSFSSIVYWCTITIFYLEMIIKIISCGFIGIPKAYLHNYFHILDIVTNVAMLSELFVAGSSGFSVLRVFRVIKIPNLIKKFSGSNSLTILMDSMRHSVSSVLSVVIAALLLAYFSAIVGVQIWVSMYGKCSFDGYPEGRSIYEYSYPYSNGCNGYAYVNNTIDGTEVYEDLHWTPYVDNFDDIFSASRTMFRIVFQIEFQSIIYNSLDISGEYSQYSKNKSGENFLFFLVVFIMSSGVTVLTIAVIYFHFYVNSAKQGRKAVFGSLMSFWAGYEEKLRSIKPLTEDTQLEKIKNWKSFTKEFQNTSLYKAFWTLFLVGPAILIVTKYQETYQMSYFLQVDCYISFLYVIDYLFFLVVKDDKLGFKKLIIHIFSSAGRQHFATMIYLVASIVIVLGTIYVAPDNNVDDNATVHYLVLIAVVARLMKLGTIFQDIASFLRILQMSLSGFLPLAAYMFIVVMIYSVFSQLIFGDITPDWGNDFHNKHFNFQTFNNTWVLLFSVGTGNLYSEIVRAYSPFLSTGMKVLLEFILCSFSVIFYVLLRCFAIMVISKYLMHYSGSLGLAGEQARQVQATWKLVSKGSNKVKKRINYDRFLDFLVQLPAPLGLNGNKVCYLDLSRFAKKILLCMPTNVSKMHDSKNDRQLFTEENLYTGSKNYRLEEKSKFVKKARKEIIKQEDGTTKEHVIYEDVKVYGTEDLKFSFRQINIAVHKAYILKQSLSDEFEFNSNRVVHQNRVREFRLQMIRLLALSKCDSNLFNSYSQKDMIAAVTNMSLLQRVDRVAYRMRFLSIMENTFSTLKRRVSAFGFAGIDYYNLSIMRKSIVYECNSVEMQIKLQTKISNILTDDLVSATRASTLSRYFDKLKRLENQINNIYFENINLSWDTSVLKEVKKIKLKSSVTAIAIDNMCNVFVAVDATSSRKGEESKSVESSYSQLKFYRTKLNSSAVVMDESASYTLQQTIDLGNLVRTIAVTNDGKRLFVGCGYDIILFSVPMNKGARAPGRGIYRQSMRFYDHTAPVNKLVIFNQYFISGGQDGVINMWNFRNETPIQTVSIGSPIFSLCILPLKLTSVTIDDIVLSDIVVAGCANGRLAVLPLPLNGQNIDATNTWSIKYFDTFKNYSDIDQINTLLTNATPVTAIASAWGFLYTGFADGNIVAWYIAYSHNTESTGSDITIFNSLSSNTLSDSMKQIQKVHLQPLFKSAVHTAPITSLQFVGEHLFSMSQDLSIVPWYPPENILATSKNDFHQSCGNGYITHYDPILSAAANKIVLVTSDEGGMIKFTSPNKIEEMLKIEGKDDNVSELVHFSFLEYNFKGCFTSHQGIVTEDVANLKISNKSHSPINVRIIIPKGAISNVFKVFINESQLTATGSRLVQLGPKKRPGIQIDPLGMAPLQISFTPSAEIDYEVFLQFLINEIHIVNVKVLGHGVKPKIKIEKISDSASDRFIDFGSVKLDQKETRSFFLKNFSSKDIFCHFLEPYYTDPPDMDTKSVYSKATNKTMQNEDKVLEYCEYGCDIKFSNRSFEIQGKMIKEIRVTFTPSCIRDTTFNIPLKLYYCGAVYTLGTLRGRSVAPKDQEILRRQTMLEQKLMISKKYASYASTIDSKSEKSATEIPDNVTSTDHTSLANSGGLRELRTWESVLNSNYVPKLLHSFGWKVIRTENRAVIMHDLSGQFIDLPRITMQARNERIFKNVPIKTNNNDVLKIDYSYDQETIFELYVGHSLLHYGKGAGKANTTIELPISTIYNTSGAREIASIGYLVLELFVYKPKAGYQYYPPKNDVPEMIAHKYEYFKPGHVITEERQNRTGIERLLYMTKIKTTQGFSIHRPGNGDMTQQLQFVPKLIVIGFERVVSSLESNRGYISEIFAGSAALQKSTATSSMFAPAVIHINQTEEKFEKKDGEKAEKKTVKSNNDDSAVIPSHVTIIEEIEGFKKVNTGKAVGNDKSSNTITKKYTAPEVAFQVGKVRESMILNRPRLRMKLDERSTRRLVKINAYRKNVMSTVDDAQFEIYTMNHSCHTAMDIHERAERLEIPGTTILPCHIRNGSENSYTHDLRVKVVTTEDDGNEDVGSINEITSLIDKISAGEYIHDDGCKFCYKLGHIESSCPRKMRGDVKTELKLSPLFNNKWFFVHDKSNIRLISSHCEGPNSTDTTEILFHYAGVVVTNITIPVRAMMENAVIATRHGQCALVRSMKDLENIHQMSYLYKPTKETLTKISENLRAIETRIEYLESPQFVNEYWTQFVKANFLKQLKRGYNKIVSISIEENLTRARAAKEEILRKQREDEAERLAYRSKANLTNTDHFHRKRAIDEAEKVIEKVNQQITYKEVYDEVAKVSNKYFRVTYTDKEELLMKEIYDTIDVEAKKAKVNQLKNDNRLNAIKLTIWLQNTTLFGMERPCSSTAAQEALKGLEFNSSGVITMDSFKRWYENDVNAGSDLTGKTYFAKLLYEQMSLEHGGQSGGTGSKNEEQLVEEERGVKLGTDTGIKKNSSKSLSSRLKGGAKHIKGVGKAVSKFTRRVSGLFSLASFRNAQKTNESTYNDDIIAGNDNDNNIQLAHIKLENSTDDNSGNALDVEDGNDRTELVEQNAEIDESDESESEGSEESSNEDSEDDSDDSEDEESDEESEDEESDEESSNEESDYDEDE